MNVFSQPDIEENGRGKGLRLAALDANPARGRTEEEPAAGQIDIRQIAVVVWRRKWLIAAVFICFQVLAFLATTQMPPRFAATATVLLTPDRLKVVDIEEVLSRDAQNESLQNQVEILRSTSLLSQVARSLGLAGVPEFNPVGPTSAPWLTEAIAEARTAITSTLLDLGILSPAAPARPPAEEIADDTGAAPSEPDWLAHVAALRAGLKIVPIPNSLVLRISYTSTDPELSARVANAIVDQLIVDQLDAQLQATKSATEWLTGQVQNLQERLRDAENAVETMRTELARAAGQSSDITRQQLEAQVAALATARSQRVALEARHERVKSAIAEGDDFGEISEFRASAIMEAYRARGAELRDQAVDIRAIGRLDDPLLRSIDVRLQSLERSTQLEARRIAEALRNDVAAAYEEEQKLAAQVRELEQKSFRQARGELRLRELEREAQASRQLYENFLARLNETSAQETLQGASARLLTPAEVPGGADTTLPDRILLAGGALGLLVGCGLVMLFEQLNNTFRSITELESQVGYPVLASLPRIGARTRRASVLRHLKEKPSGSLAEAVRNLRTSILRSDAGAAPRVVMFTSSVPREGKSTTAYLVALTSQQMGRSAIVVECDFRLSSLADLSGLRGKRPGLLSVLEGRADLDEAIAQDPETGLSVLAVRPKEAQGQVNAADILMSRRFANLVSTLRGRYELVVLDTPPALLVTDARIVSSLADAVVFAVRWDHTPRGAVKEGLRELSSLEAPVAGVFFTMVYESRAARGGFDGYGYYRGRYRGYYTS